MENLVEKTISLSTKLRSLVFIPDLYEDGVEATKYPYVPGQYVDAKKIQLQFPAIRMHTMLNIQF